MKSKEHLHCKIDGVYPATQIHLSIPDLPPNGHGRLTRVQQEVITSAISQPFVGLVNIQFMRSRVIVTTTIPPKDRRAQAKQFQAAVEKALNGVSDVD